MVLPYLKGLMVIKKILNIVLVYILWCFCIQSLGFLTGTRKIIYAKWLHMILALINNMDQLIKNILFLQLFLNHQLQMLFTKTFGYKDCSSYNPKFLCCLSITDMQIYFRNNKNKHQNIHHNNGHKKCRKRLR